MPFIAIGGRQVHYLERAGSVAIVLLHAGAGSCKQWNKVSEKLDPAFHVVAPDLWGYGNTEPWLGASELSHDDQASLVEDLVEHLGLSNIHVVGHPYGGATAIRLAVASPGLIRSLTLIEPILMTLLKGTEHQGVFEEYDSIASGFLRAAARGEPEAGWRAFINYRNGQGTWERLSEETKARFLSTTASSVSGYKSNLQNPTTIGELKAIRIPTLLIFGSQTTIPDRTVSEIVRDTLPNCEYHVLVGAEHMSPLSHPTQIAALVNGHVEQHNDSSGRNECNA